jgi:signal transduction histidine kinase
VRARLLVIVLVLVGLLAVGLGVPLAVTTSQARQSELFTQQLTDTIFYASLAERPITQDETSGLVAELERYDEVYGVAVMVFNRDGTMIASSRTAAPALDSAGKQRVALALANRRSETYALRWPWDDRPIVIAEPVLVDTEVRGAAVTVAPTDDLRLYELRVWLVVAAAALLALTLAVLVALPIVRWILRPVRRLDEGTGRVASAVLAGGAPDPVADNSGPPELRRLSASFDRMASTVAQAYGAQRAFVADASHQLRNPLTALRLRLSNLDGHVDGVAEEDHAAALEEAERLSTLLDGLLALARAERTAPLVPLDVDAGVDDRIEAWRPLAEHTGLRLRREGLRGLRVRATAGAIETLLDAVLDNAVKFTPSGGAVTVSVDATADNGGLVEISVRDTGPGIPTDELERATDRFWRSPAQSSVDGSGLGLAIAARTVELAGGELALSLPRDGGLRVAARLPRLRPERDAQQQVAQEVQRG